MSKHPTILDVAQAAGVSTATVSRVLDAKQGEVTERTRTKVEAAVKRLGYRRNSLARGLVTGTSGIVGVLIPDVAGPLYAQMARGIEDVLEAHGKNSMMVTSDRDTVQEQASVELLLGRRVDARVLIGSSSPLVPSKPLPATTCRSCSCSAKPTTRRITSAR